MPFCVGCGFELEQDWNACANCGKLISKIEIRDKNEPVEESKSRTRPSESQRLDDPRVRYDIVFKDKSPGISVLATLLLPGAGHLYTERIVEGLIYLLVGVILGTLYLTYSNSACAFWLILFYIFIVIDVLTPGPFSVPDKLQ